MLVRHDVGRKRDHPQIDEAGKGADNEKEANKARHLSLLGESVAL